MARYDIRDLLGHWVKPRRREQQMCPHACCRNRRVHPDNFPVILPRGILHKANERELLNHLNRHGASGPKADQVARQVVGELDRRETSEKAARARRDRAKDRRASRDSEFRAYQESQWIAAEAQTRGVMLNRAGQAAHIDERSLFTGPESRVRKYASRELLDYFESNPRVSRAEFLGGAEGQRRGARNRAEGGLLGISRAAPSASTRAAKVPKPRQHRARPLVPGGKARRRQTAHRLAVERGDSTRLYGVY